MPANSVEVVHAGLLLSSMGDGLHRPLNGACPLRHQDVNIKLQLSSCAVLHENVVVSLFGYLRRTRRQ